LAGVKEDEDKKGRQRDGRRQCTLQRAEAQIRTPLAARAIKDTAGCKAWPISSDLPEHLKRLAKGLRKPISLAGEMFLI
jgi:hypothetical protein